jgi:competence protein ComEC
MDALNINDISIVLKLQYQNTSLFFPGDLDDAEILKNLPVQARILKSPHHGSKKANSPSLFDQVKPEYIVISGQEHIRQQVLQLIEQERIRPFDLRKDGALTIEVQGNVIKFKRFNGNKYF